jgi:uncharacterized protein (TIGR02271 family)
VPTTKQEIVSWRGHELYDRGGSNVGKIEEIYLDAETDQPEWALVKTGLFDSKSTFGAAARRQRRRRRREELRVGTRQRETGRVRLRKYVVTEDVHETVPVRREEARVETEPITDDNIEQAMAGPDISEAEHEVELREEEPVVEKRTVPKERVRLDVDTVSEDREVSETVRKEQIEVDEDRDRDA